jgi:hypothetical protein
MAEVMLEDTRISTRWSPTPTTRPPPAPTALRVQTSWSRIWRRARRSSREMCIWE